MSSHSPTYESVNYKIHRAIRPFIENYLGLPSLSYATLFVENAFLQSPEQYAENLAKIERLITALEAESLISVNKEASSLLETLKEAQTSGKCLKKINEAQLLHSTQERTDAIGILNGLVKQLKGIRRLNNTYDTLTQLLEKTEKLLSPLPEEASKNEIALKMALKKEEIQLSLSNPWPPEHRWRHDKKINWPLSEYMFLSYINTANRGSPDLFYFQISGSECTGKYELLFLLGNDRDTLYDTLYNDVDEFDRPDTFLTYLWNNGIFYSTSVVKHWGLGKSSKCTEILIKGDITEIQPYLEGLFKAIKQALQAESHGEEVYERLKLEMLSPLLLSYENVMEARKAAAAQAQANYEATRSSSWWSAPRNKNERPAALPTEPQRASPANTLSIS